MKKIFLFTVSLSLLFAVDTSDCMHRVKAVKMHANKDHRAKYDRGRAKVPRNKKAFTVPRKRGNSPMERDALFDGAETAVPEFVPMIATSTPYLGNRAPHVSKIVLPLVSCLFLLTIASPVAGQLMCSREAFHGNHTAIQQMHGTSTSGVNNILNNPASAQQKLNSQTNRCQALEQQRRYWAEQKAINEHMCYEDEKRYLRRIALLEKQLFDERRKLVACEVELAHEVQSRRRADAERNSFPFLPTMRF